MKNFSGLLNACQLYLTCHSISFIIIIITCLHTKLLFASLDIIYGCHLQNYMWWWWGILPASHSWKGSQKEMSQLEHFCKGGHTTSCGSLFHWLNVDAIRKFILTYSLNLLPCSLIYWFSSCSLGHDLLCDNFSIFENCCHISPQSSLI